VPISYATNERGVGNGPQVFAPINIPIEIPQQIGAALTAAVSSGSVALGGRGRDVDNRTPPVEVRVKHEVHITHKVDIHVHHVRVAVNNQEEPNLPRVNEEYYSLNYDESVWV
jgi:hypothetical protein